MNPFELSASSFQTPLQQTVYFEKYSRYRYDLGRREAWVETVDRAVNYLRELSHDRLDPQDYAAIHRGIFNLDVMPSMRLLAMAGEPARRQNVSIYNCSYLTLDSIQAFTEIMLLSMNGVGVGYSVERKYVAQLPPVARQTGKTTTVLVMDSTEGWVNALYEALDAWWSGLDVNLDVSLVRPAGAILRTKGGRASGPEPLKEAMAAIRNIILARQGQQLRPIDAHDIACWIASASISGGVRRSALISLFDAHDAEMLHAKAGAFWEHNAQRMYANNSAVIGNSTSEGEVEALIRQMDENGTGEPGLFNRDGARALRPSRRSDAEYGLNPCGEIALRNMQTCNLSSAVARATDGPLELGEKVRLATIIGTIQSMADNFPGLRPEWRWNQQEERLLGVDLNGQMDSRWAQDAMMQRDLRGVAVRTNEEYADRLLINRSAAVTTVKPSGNSSQMLNASSGLHARWSPYYTRHVRFNRHSPVRKLLEAHGVTMHPEVGQNAETATTFVVPFPVKSPEGAIYRNDRSAIEQLQYALQVRRNYTEHQPSVTIYYRPEELEEVVDWCRENKDYIAGLSFLRSSDHAYELAPYVDITREEYEAAAAAFPAIDFSRLPEFEEGDLTTGSGELACVAGACETM
jgi:ribonucleoside-triphosphate reductase (thioredoxin)